MVKYCLLFSILTFCVWAEDPFGTDVSMIQLKKRPRVSDGFHPGFAFIRFHQQYSTHIDCPRSHFIPSSSEYMRQAMSLYGSGLGFLYGCDRLLRENSDDWLYAKISTPVGLVKSDPVPRFATPFVTVQRASELAL